MSEIHTVAMAHIPSRVSSLAVAGVKRLAERGSMDILCLDQAHDWLKRGMALHSAAFEDPGWKSVVESQNLAQLKNDRNAQFRVVVEFLRLTEEGADPDTTCAYLNLSDEQRETATTLRSFWPDTSASLVRAAQKRREEEEVARTRHEDRLKRAFLCFQTGYSLDPYNREINFILAEYYSVGLGVDRDEEMGLVYLRRSAALGHTGAQRKLSYRYSAALRNTAEWESSLQTPEHTPAVHRPACTGQA